jgi:HicA toxin of bacterial toxin-antitoxin,
MSSKHRRTLEAVFDNANEASIRWNDMIAMLVYYGGEVLEREGSRVQVRLNGIPAFLHKPHPGKELKPWAVRYLRAFLIRAGLTP